ncbi:hypothetical protein MVEN_00828100 [Mycena venus]|uniref:CRAL-TRIO domain-containing protein n=1 Tax=Mycena venus TaxID=2733690 RepID=A0A8H7D3N7_9AGAR|nr:hypothetical protein MVEN_00828100 [Mycena venus]
MRLQANGFEAWVTIDDREVDQFKPETVDYPSGQTSWIASELDKGFSIHWRNTDVFCQTASRIWVDGIEVAGEIILGPNREASVSGRRTSGSTMSPFKFSPLNLTDDDAFLDSGGHKDIGLIRVEIWTVNMLGKKQYSNVAPTEESKIHERSKKGGTHQIKFAEEVAQPPRSAAIIEYLERSPIVTFTFKYRSLDLLRADGIAPNQGSSKRKALASPSGSEIKTPKRVKKEGGQQLTPTLGEIIDLTRERHACGYGDYRLDVASRDLFYASPIHPPALPLFWRGGRKFALPRPIPIFWKIRIGHEKHVQTLLYLRRNHQLPVVRDRRGKHMENANHEKFELLNSQYTENLEAVLALQGTLRDDILPSVTDELELDAKSIQWAKEWLSDTCTLFRILRRNKFTRSFAMESIRKTLVWRFTHLWPPDPPSRLPFVQCLPPTARDPFGRPILVIKVVSFNDSSDAYKPLIIRGLECLRLHLKRLNGDSYQRGAPTLQYVILLDLKNLSTQSLNIDLVQWTLFEAIPQFPGLLAAAMMINYSWAHAGLWSIAKRVLPAAAISRVFFSNAAGAYQLFLSLDATERLWRNSSFSDRVTRSFVE